MCVVTGLLLLSLACLEIPEMSALKDDVSNDFTFLRTDSASSIVVVEVRVADTEMERVSTISAAAPACSSAFEAASDSVPRDLLALHSLWRT
jgi:hypothetical protein